jgi:NADH-quinone oxidoreductase subunit L
MWVPLVALSVLALLGGVLNLPFTNGLQVLDHWLEPVFGSALTPDTASSATKWGLAIVAMAASAAGIFLAYLVYQRERARAVEPDALAHAWYVDETLAKFADGPGRAAADAVTWELDRKVVDGAVNGAGGLTRLVSSRLRHVESGYVRNYALWVSIGTIVLLGWFLTRAVG